MLNKSPKPQRLEAGDFFGEIALLKDGERTATITAVTECQLLVLSVGAFKRLLTGNPEMRETLTQVMDERLGAIEDNS